MPIDEYLFAKVAKYFKKKNAISTEELERTVMLNDVIEKLTILSRAITGDPIEIFHAEKEGGLKNNSFFLPSSFAYFPDRSTNYDFYIFRIFFLAIQKKLNYNWKLSEDNTSEISLKKFSASIPLVLKELFKEFSALEEMHLNFISLALTSESYKNVALATWLYGKWMRESQQTDKTNQFENILDVRKEMSEQKNITILKAKAVEEIVSVEIDKKQQEDYVMTHNFEKVDTAEEFDDIWRDFDGDDDLKDHQEALDELNMKFTVRIDDTAHSVYQADFIENTTISESADIEVKGSCLTYDEWDYSNRAYKKNFCKLYPSIVLKTDHQYYKKTIEKYATVLIGLRKMLANINNKMLQQRRQSQGDEFDIDALIDLFVDVQTKHTPSENIYISKRKKEKDLSLLILLDVSLSSDGYVDGNRIIDVEKQVSILFAEILHELDVDFSIHSFYSKTRNYSTYQTLKGFDDSWDKSKHVIGAVEPDGYTRIGAALRHSGTLLQNRETKNKWIILITDGKPNDFDKYEGKYGIQDVKQALLELGHQSIHTYALAIEAQAKYYLPQMFGQNNYQVLTTPIGLLGSMVNLYEKIKSQS